jgi:uncharacterized membrane protein
MVAPKIVLVLLAIWILAGQFARGLDFTGFAYLPIFNPLDLTLMAIMGYLYWSTGPLSGRYQVNESTGIRLNVNFRRQTLAGFCFIWTTVILLRSLHHWQPVTYQIESLYRSFLVQTSVSILWSIIGVIAAIIAHRIQSRQLWLVAAGILMVAGRQSDVTTLGAFKIAKSTKIGIIMCVIDRLN